MQVDQRNNGASVTTSDGSSPYMTDRWRLFTRVGASLSYFRNATEIGGTGSAFFSGVQVVSQKSPAATDQFRLAQSIEGLNVDDLNWGSTSAKTVTLSFWSCHSLTGTHSGSVYNADVSRSFVFEYTQNVATTWEYKTVTIPGCVDGTWLRDTGIGIGVSFDYGTGSTFATSSTNSWLSSTALRSIGSVTLVSTASAVLRITCVQLEQGKATPFERRSYGQELALCQRYFETGGFFLVGASVDIHNVGCQCSFNTTKRAAPSVVQTNIDAQNVSATPKSSDISTSGFLSFRLTTMSTAVRFQYKETWTSSAEL